MIDASHWHWPQWTWIIMTIVLLVLSQAGYAAERKAGTAALSIAMNIAQLLILAAGGFFK